MAPIPPRRILVPVDFSKQSREALKYAVRMAQQLSSKLVVVHIGPPIPAFACPLPEATALQTAQRIDTLRDRQAAARQALENEVSPGAGQVPFEFPFEEGDLTDVTVRSAGDLSGSLVVMGSHGRSGLRRALLGAVAEKTARLSPVPVLIAR